MADAVRHLLPPLHDGHKVSPLPKSGTWHPLGHGSLQVIANGLNTAASPGGAAIVSVPDVWAQVTLFHNALSAETHPLHRQAVAEWRGLLACFALGAYHTQDLTAELMSIGAGQSAWASLAGRLPPQCALLDGARLNEVALVRVGPQLIALAQPLTLLAPSRSLRDASSARPPVPWMEDGRLQDPLLAAGLSPTERRVLAHMLAQLCQDLEAAHLQRPGIEMLLGLARSFHEDARAGIANLAATRFEQVPAKIDLPRLPAFRALLPRNRVMAGAEDDESHCLLRLRPGLNDSKLRGIILVDQGLPQQLGQPSGDVQVWRHHSMRMLANRPDAIAQVRAEAQDSGYLVVEAKDLFLPTLYRAGMEGDGSFEHHASTTRGHLLPLSPLLAAVLDRAGLARSCQMAPGGAGGTLVTLHLPLRDGPTVTVLQRYPTEDAAEPPFALSLWPDFRADWWRLHMGWSSAATRIQFVVSGFVSLHGIAEAFQAAADGYAAVAAARVLLGGGAAALTDTTWLNQNSSAVRALYKLAGVAEVAVMENHRSPVPQPAGLLLLPDPAPVAAPSGTAKVGIDFGTTNTAVYLQIGAQEPEPLRIEARQLRAYRNVDQSLDELDAEFLPVNAIEVPFQTILRDRLAPSADGQRQPFRNTLIYFAQRRQAALDKAMKADDLFANLKWGDDQASRERVELFLAQIVMLAAAEAAKLGVRPQELSFHFSFPEAFRPQQAASFQGAARNAVKRGLLTVAGPGLPAASIKFQTESVATAQYFIHKLRTPATEGIITFDIGGQTTDVAVVQSRSLGAERLAWRGSFQLAGRHLLIDHLRECPAILDQLASGRPELSDLVRTLKATGQASRERRTLATELVVNSPAFAAAFEDVFPTLIGMPTADRLRAVALTGLAGLFDYIGRTVRHLAEQGLVEPRANSPVSLCLGGRASLLYRMLLQPDGEQEKVLSFFTAAAADTMRRGQIVFSQAPKQEVAYGLVRDDRELVGGVATAPLLGEAVRFGGNDAPASALVSSLDPEQVWRIENPSEFRRFIGLLPGLGVQAGLTDQALGNMAGQATSEIAAALRLARQERSSGQPDPNASILEPPFIVLLRLLVARLAAAPGTGRP